MIVDGLGSSEAGGQLSHVSAGGGRDDRHVPARAGQPRAVGRPRPRARARRRRARLAGQERPAGARLPRRPGQDRAHVPGRSTASATPCRATAPGSRRRRHRAARPRRGDDQLGRREDLRRGGRGGDQGPPGRVRLRRRRAARASGGATRWSPIVRLRDGARPATPTCSTRRRATSPGTSCRRRSCSSTRSSARRPARPTTAGRDRRRTTWRADLTVAEPGSSRRRLLRDATGTRRRGPELSTTRDALGGELADVQRSAVRRARRPVVRRALTAAESPTAPCATCPLEDRSDVARGRPRPSPHRAMP